MYTTPCECKGKALQDLFEVMCGLAASFGDSVHENVIGCKRERGR